MFTMYAVCASGIGTSLLSRKLIQDAVRGLGYDISDIRVSYIGVQEAIGTNMGVFVTGSTIAKNIPDMPRVEKVIVMNVINGLVGMKKALEPVSEKAEMVRKVKKLWM